MEGDNEIGKGNALIRFFTAKDPRHMKPKEWARTVCEIQYCLDLQTRLFAESVASLFPKSS